MRVPLLTVLTTTLVLAATGSAAAAGPSPYGSGGRGPDGASNPELLKPVDSSAPSIAADQTYSDPPNDAGAALEITQVKIADRRCAGAGKVRFEISVPSQENLAPEDYLEILLDTKAGGDANSRNADYWIALDANGGSGGGAVIRLYRWNGSQWILTSTPPDASYNFGAIIEFAKSDIGKPASFRFNVYAHYPDSNPTSTEYVPAQGQPLLSYRMAGCDRRDPEANALESDLRAGGTKIRLNYRITDNSGRARWTLTVRRSDTHRVTLSEKFRLQPTNGPGNEFFFLWAVPARIKGWHEFCVRASDAAGNRSRRDCEDVEFRRIRTNAQIQAELSGGRVKIQRLWLRNLPKGTRVRVDCARKCSLHERKTMRRKGTFVSSRFKGKLFPLGVAIVVRAEKPRLAGHYEKITITSDGLRQCTRTLAPGLSKPGKRCR